MPRPPEGLPHDALHRAARRPAADVDLSAVTRRAEALDRRRTEARTAGAVLAVIALAVPLVLRGPDQLSLEPVPVPADQVPTSATPLPALPTEALGPTSTPAAAPDLAGGVSTTRTPGAGAGGQVARPAPGAPAPATAAPVPAGPVVGGTGGGTEQVAAPTTEPSQAPRPTASAEPSRATVTGTATHPLAAGCTADNRGALPGESRRCGFTARALGGYRLQGGGLSSEYGDWEVRVRRGDDVTVYRDGEAGPCAGGVLQPGDRVDVVVTGSQSGMQLYEVRAGEGMGC